MLMCEAGESAHATSKDLTRRSRTSIDIHTHAKRAQLGLRLARFDSVR
jgi:hypothetical protein